MVRALGPGADGAPRPGLSGSTTRSSSRTASSGDGLAIAEQIDAVRRALGMAVEASGSNNWAIGEALSAGDGPLIAGDPHLSPSMPGIWYQVSLRHGERFARGASMAGLPGVYMGQNDDVGWTFTNIVADVQDLFIERIEGDRYLFEGEWLDARAPSARRSPSGAATSPRCSTCASPTTARSSTRRSGPTPRSRWRCAGSRSTSRRSIAGVFSMLDLRSGPELVEMLGAHTTPVSNLVWADRARLDRLQAGRPAAGPARRLPRRAEAGLERRVRVGRESCPTPSMPELTDPESGFVVTANNRVVGDDYPHHVTSEWFDGFRARRIEQTAGPQRRARPRRLRSDADRRLLDPRRRGRARLGRLRPDAQREMRAIERLRSWDGRLDPGSVAASIYQAFLLRLAREVARAAIGDRDLAERWLDRADNGFIAHVTCALALALAPDGALGGGRRLADRPPLGRPRPRRPAGRRSTTSRSVSVPTRRTGAGAACTRSSSPTRWGRPTRSCGASSTAASAPAAPRRP